MSFFRDGEITLTLLGSLSSSVQQYFAELLIEFNLNSEQILFLGPVSEDQIVSIASMHHIGLSSEYLHNQNRNLCLTNKIFMYLLAGNALLVSDTSAQKTFISENSGIGSLYEQENATSLFIILKLYFDNPELLESHRNNSLQLGITKYNWNIEKNKFMRNVKQVLAR
jgi:hypothetical protein